MVTDDGDVDRRGSDEFDDSLLSSAGVGTPTDHRTPQEKHRGSTKPRSRSPPRPLTAEEREKKKEQRRAHLGRKAVAKWRNLVKQRKEKRERHESEEAERVKVRMTAYLERADKCAREIEAMLVELAPLLGDEDEPGGAKIAPEKVEILKYDAQNKPKKVSAAELELRLHELDQKVREGGALKVPFSLLQRARDLHDKGPGRVEEERWRQAGTEKAKVGS